MATRSPSPGRRAARRRVRPGPLASARRRRLIRAVDLFSGGGGSDSGFVRLLTALGIEWVPKAINPLSRVEPGRRGFRLGLSVSPRFLWECLTSPTVARFPRPAHRTGLADFPHPALRLGSVHLRHAKAPPAVAGTAAPVRDWTGATDSQSVGSPARRPCGVAPETSSAACRCIHPTSGRRPTGSPR